MTTIDARWFKFPIRIYDPQSIKQIIQEAKDEEMGIENEETIIEPAWVGGHARLPYHVILNSIWTDTHTKMEDIKDVAEKGFDTTRIITREYGDYYCMWERDKFEKRLEEFINNYESMNPQRSISLVLPAKDENK